MLRRFVCWLFVLLASASAAAARPEVDVRREAGAFVVRAEAELDADQRTAWLTVTDYEHLPQFVPGIRSARVLARVASGATERLLIEQTGEFRFFLFAQPVQVWLDVTHEAPGRVLARSVLPSGISLERSTLREFEGSYALSAIDATRTRFVYQARFEPVQSMLPLLGTLVVRHTVTEQFRAMAAEIERRAARNRTEQAAR
jgi:Polyketide cyclase / dehydrase and lipid transport